jgi:probable rRNA maturation factor
MIDIINLQKSIAISPARFKKFAAGLVLHVSEASDRTFSVAFVPDDRMRELNLLFRGKDSTTDVLSFPREPDEFDPEKDNLGDIVISADQAQRQALDAGLPLEDELRQLILHGLLHLCGYDHETDNGEMNARELELREQLGI